MVGYIGNAGLSEHLLRMFQYYSQLHFCLLTVLYSFSVSIAVLNYPLTYGFCFFVCIHNTCAVFLSLKLSVSRNVGEHKNIFLGES